MTPLETRHALGLSIADMARALDVHRSTWTKWECGDQQPPAVAETAMRMLLFLQSKRLLDSFRLTSPGIQ